MVYMREHILLSNLISNKKALDTLANLVANASGKSVGGCTIEKIVGEQVDIPTEDTFF